MSPSTPTDTAVTPLTHLISQANLTSMKLSFRNPPPKKKLYGNSLSSVGCAKQLPNKTKFSNSLSPRDAYATVVWIIIGLGNGLSLVWHQAINETNAISWALQTKFNEIWIKIWKYWRKWIENVICKMSAILSQGKSVINTLRLRQNGCHFPDNILK